MRLFLRKSNILSTTKASFWKFTRSPSHSCTGFHVKDLTNTVKLDIENHWKQKVNNGEFDINRPKDKFYVLPMFPYPSGSLHMGHVRVYAISDTMARFYRMNGKNVFHPIGWDAFGLPAENAAISRKIEPNIWTQLNIAQMREQLLRLGCSFDWSHELSTCDENYYKWTQMLFLMLFKKGLAYQNKALVNWDPVDETVLADEQVDNNGCSWRSGAKVEKKLLNQWFIKTSKFAESLLDGLNDPTLQDWRDIINLQKHWIGECNGYGFQLKLNNEKEQSIRLWTMSPEHLMDSNGFIVLKSNHYLPELVNGKFSVSNPFSSLNMPVVIYDNIEYPDNCDSYLAAPSFLEMDRILGSHLNIPFNEQTSCDCNNQNLRELVLNKAIKLNIGGYKISSKLKDWLISRQRYWGTPIPIINCQNCGSVPVNEEDLPVKLPKTKYKDENDIKTVCPKCNNANARKETDTMDTFVDSSWYYLRYLDSKNHKNIFDHNLISKFMPVDLYIGGKEHAVLHLYYARFMNHFLHSLNLLPHSEPFKRLLVQGMVMGRSFRIKKTGKYITEKEVKIVDAKKNKAIELETNEPVVMTWEKMSKSKLNGVDPSEMIEEYGTDTTRLIVLADVAPTSHRNWSSATFPGILNWQKRLWLTLNYFYDIRSQENLENFKFTNEQFIAEDEKLYDARNYYIKGATFNYRHSHQLSVAISKMQGLTNSLRRASKEVIKYGKNFERAFASQIIMLAPMAPHFASEMWSKFIATPNRLNDECEDIQWTEEVLKQNWPTIDMEYKLDLTIKINAFENAVIKLPRHQLDKITYNEAMDIAFNTDSVTSYVTDRKIRTTNFVLYPGIEAILNIYLDKTDKLKNKTLEQKIRNK